MAGRPAPPVGALLGPDPDGSHARRVRCRPARPCGCAPGVSGRRVEMPRGALWLPVPRLHLRAAI